MAGLTAKKDHLSHEMGMHTEGLLGRTQQRFFDVAEASNGYRYPDAPDVDFNKRAEIDCAKLETRAINARLRELLNQGVGTVVLRNPGAKHSIAVGILHRLNLHIEGSCGYFACGLIDGPNVTIKGRVGWACGENMMAGTIVIEKNGGSQFGAALRGGDLVCKGSVGWPYRHRPEGRHHHRRRRYRFVLRLHDATRPYRDPRQCRKKSR